MTSFRQSMSDCFPLATREAGSRLFSSGQVRIYAVADKFLAARVGPENHETALRLLRDDLQSSCNCQDAREDDASCAHAWALLLAADEKGYLRGVQRGASPEERLLEKIRMPRRPRGRPRAPSWKEVVRAARPAPQDRWSRLVPDEQTQIVYWLDAAEILEDDPPVLNVGTRRRKQKGGWCRVKPAELYPEEVGSLRDPEDRRIIEMLLGPPPEEDGLGGYGGVASPFPLSPALTEAILPRAAGTGRLFLARDEELDFVTPLAWDPGEPWQATLSLEPGESAWALRGCLDRGPERMELYEPDILLAAGFLAARGKLARLRLPGDFVWISTLRQSGELRIPSKEIEAFRREALALPRPLEIDWPAPLSPEEVRVEPKPRLRVFLPKFGSGLPATRLYALVWLDYGDISVRPADPRDRVPSEDFRRLVVRDRPAEARAAETLSGLGLYYPTQYYEARQIEHDYEVPPKDLPRVVEALVQAGWKVEAEEGVYRRAGRFKISVSSGIDWFDLDGGVEFDGQFVPWPRLLRALREGKKFIPLGDGSQGVLPDEWLRRVEPILGLGEAEGDAVRFKPSQAMMLDALLAAEEGATCDEAFARLRERLGAFGGVRPKEPPPGFQGELRPYQKLGLGWLHFLRDLGFGGCLADEMGLGKTVQVLAMLEERRAAGAGPSLVVMPRSLVFNWISEARRFAPALRVADWSRGDRPRGNGRAEADVVLATYGTLRRDAAWLKDLEFDTVVLDEAQAIKNADTATAKAARLLKGRHRLALSGTPVENHLGEVWSLFEFLNPGMLGRSAAFPEDPNEADRKLLARALRPFILRRTKAQVVADLPEKVEQTLACDLDPEERRRYDELKEHYRRTIGERIEREGLGKAKIHVLEALLRLRQASCHPGLLDPALRGEPSTKLELVLERIREVTSEGHKALVFSQFVKFLSIVRDRLDGAGIPYAYLDGQTRDREKAVRRFQEDPACPLFLVSLKAGGLGLNLTAAEYVFLLDPWWNPAVEAQAVDRTHRIGQTRRVFAYRIVARETVEEKILELQRAKRDLAEAIVNEDNALLRDLTREDLELLLS
jgi:superfamily II DNA or RNA helicase